MENWQFQPIGYVRTAAHFRSEAPRQAAFAAVPGVVELLPDPRLQEALADLAGFDRAWLLFVFHLNAGSGWNAKVRPPVAPGNRRYGVFATRAPYRPNPIGMSCVEIERIEPGKLFYRAADLLDGTPVLDVKPYVPEVDSFPDAAAGWRDEAAQIPAWSLESAPEAAAKAEWIRRNGGPDLANAAQVQLRYEPLDHHRRRVTPLPGVPGAFQLGFRTWRILFRADPESRRIFWFDVRSGYAPEELLPGAADPYCDKELHRAFLRAGF